MKYILAPEQKEEYFLGEFISFREINNSKLNLSVNTFLNEKIYVAEVDGSSVTFVFLSPLESPTFKTRNGDIVSFSRSIVFKEEAVGKEIDFLQLSEKQVSPGGLIAVIVLFIFLFLSKEKIKAFVFNKIQNRKIKKLIINGQFKELLKENSYPENQDGFQKLKEVLGREIYKKDWNNFKRKELPDRIKECLHA